MLDYNLEGSFIQEPLPIVSDLIGYLEQLSLDPKRC